MKFGALTPTLATIERGLFGQAHPEPPAPELSGDEAAPVEIGDALRAMIARRAAAARAPRAVAGAQAVAGDFWWLHLDAGVEQAVALLVRKVEDDAVQGWLVAGETAYASDRDWVLQQEDAQAALDPRLGMVQLWNAVTVPRHRLFEPAGSMAAKAFAELAQVAGAAVTPASAGPAPGRIGLVDTDGVAWVCGTPLGTSDPRRAYQALYARLAGMIAVRPADAPDASPPAPSAAAANDAAPGHGIDIAARRTPRRAWRNGDFWRGAGIAAALVMAVGLPYTRMLQRTGPGGQDRVVAMRGLSQPTTAVLFDVHFVGTATVADVTALLQASGLNIASGPAPDGAYVLSATAADAASAAKALDRSRLVVSWTRQKP
jgi:hypothetical protein